MERKSIYIFILSITTIIASCFAIYFGVSKKSGEDAIESNRSQNIVNEDIVIDKQENVQPEENIEAKEVKKIDVASNLDDEQYLYRSNERVKMRIKDGKVSISFLYAKISSNKMWQGDLNKYYGIANLYDRVVDAQIFSSVGTGDLIFFLLMENGQVQLAKPVDNGMINIFSKLDGYSNIIRIDTAVYEENDEEIKTICLTDNTGKTSVLDVNKIYEYINK